MKNQFFYTREQNIELPDGQKEVKKFTDSFSIDKVIRTVEMENGQRLVLLDDIHERLERIPQFDSKRTKITGYTKERNTFQSEIYLSKEEGDKLMEILKAN